MVRQNLFCSAYPQASRMKLVLPRLSNRHWNLNQFPFRPLVISWGLRIGLLLTDDRCQETRVLAASRILTWIWMLLTPGYAFLIDPQDLTTLLRIFQDALLPDNQYNWSFEVSATGLAPIIFGSSTLYRSAITRCLKDGCF